MERIILQGNARDVLDRLRELLSRPGAKDVAVQVTVEPAPEPVSAQDDPVAEGLRRGLAEANRGELIEHERVLDWLESLGSDRELPMPKLRASDRSLGAVADIGEIFEYLKPLNPAAAQRIVQVIGLRAPKSRFSV